MDNVSKLDRNMKTTPSKIQAETSVDNVLKLERDSTPLLPKFRPRHQLTMFQNLSLRLQNSDRDINGQCFKIRQGFETTPSKIRTETTIVNVLKLNGI